MCLFCLKHELVKKVLTSLTNTSAEVVQEVGEDKVFVFIVIISFMNPMLSI